MSEASSLPSDMPPYIKEIGVIQMNDPNSPFLYDAVNSKKADGPSIRDGEFMVQHAQTAMNLGTLRDTLQKEMPDIKFSITHFENWGTTISNLLLYVKPETREQVTRIIKAAKTHNIKVGMGGAYHTWSPTYPDSGGMIINTCDLSLPLLPPPDVNDWTSSRMRLNSTSTQVTIAPGVTTGQLMQFFLDNNVCFTADVILPSVTYGGVFSGGCHGVGKTQPSMSDWIKSMTVVDGNGDIKVIPDDFATAGVSSEDILKAASASLGLFGVILDVTVEVSPMKNACVQNVFSHKLSLLRKDHLGELTELIRKNDSLEIFWFPFNSIFDKFISLEDGKLKLTRGLDDKELSTGKVVRLATNRESSWWWNPWNDDLWSREIDFTTDQVTKDPGVPLYSMIMDVITGGAMSIGKAIFGSMFNQLTPLSLALAFKMLKFQYGTLQPKEVVKVPWAIHYRDAIDLTYAYDMEFAFPIDINNPVVLTDAVKVVVDTTEKYSAGGLFFHETKGKGVNAFPLSLTMELRIMKKSKAFLCPASLGDQEHVLYVEVLSVVNTPGVNGYFKEIAKGWENLGGVTHWQKQWTFLDDKGTMVEYLKGKYGDNLTKFKTVRDAMKIDPDDMFVNSVYKEFLK